MEFNAGFNRIEQSSLRAAWSARQKGATARSNPVILCVDDEPDLLTFLRLLLAAQGLEVIQAANAMEALDLVAKERPDLIITDCAMPDMSGLELCHTLRERNDTRDIPIILHSGKDLCQDDYPGLFDRFVLKPAEPVVFVRTVRGLLAATRTRH